MKTDESAYLSATKGEEEISATFCGHGFTSRTLNGHGVKKGYIHPSDVE